VANRLETHVYYDGERWRIYTERAADFARFTKWFGTPDRMGRDDEVAHWDNIPADDLRIRKRHKRPGKPGPAARRASKTA